MGYDNDMGQHEKDKVMEVSLFTWTSVFCDYATTRTKTKLA